MKTPTLDRAGAAGSLACIAHCVALPIVAIGLPFLAAVAQAEWIHWAFTALAVAASTGVIATSPSARVPRFMVPVGFGLLLLIGALFAEHWNIDEAIPTVIGGLILATAHIRRIYTLS